MPLLTLYQLESPSGDVEKLGPLSYEVEQSFADFREFLCNLKMFPFEFDFWDSRNASRMHRLFERGNKMVDHESIVTVIPVTGCEENVRSVVKDTTTVSGNISSAKFDHFENLVANSRVSNTSSKDKDNEVGLHKDQDKDKSPVVDSESPWMQPLLEEEMLGRESDQRSPLELPECEYNSNQLNVIDLTTSSEEDCRLDFQSTLISADLLSTWKMHISRLETFMSGSNYKDHRWGVKLWDEDNKPHGFLACLECKCEFSSNKKGDMDRVRVNNCFTNFKNKHITTKKHWYCWCRFRKLSTADDDLKSRMKASVLDDRALVTLAIKIMERVSGEEPGEKKTFLLVGDVNREPFYLFHFRVVCTYCNDDMALVPQQRNLEHNLREHLAGPRHQTAVRNFVMKKGDKPLLSGKPGRPPRPDGRDVKQKTIHKYFAHDQDAPSGSSARGINDANLDLSQLCWGLWREVVEWGGMQRQVKGLLHDQVMGENWWAEAYVKVEVFNYTTGLLVQISGLFRHRNCSRMSRAGGGFEDLTCEWCWNIKLETDFRLRVFREAQTNEKRGMRDTGKGRRLEYLTTPEIYQQARSFNKLKNFERIRSQRFQARICLLQTKIPSLKDTLREAANRKDITRFCQAVVLAHKRDAFGGKSALWDLLNDIVLNLNRGANKWSKGSKVICQALYQHGGRRVVDCLAMNSIGPSLNTLQRDRRGMLCFQAGFQEEQFKFVGAVYSALKIRLGITGDVPCIIAEDETAVKKSVRWLAKTDQLVGFCGPKDNHICVVGHRIVVGSGEGGFHRILEAFEEERIGSQARIFIVNPLHSAFPRLCILATVTCNRFDHLWVKSQWEICDAMWSEFCRNVVGPLLGHASDGDPRRRKLMLADYTRKGSNRHSLGWRGWVFTHFYVRASHMHSRDPYGLHDQDPLHIGKKMVGPLDSVIRVLRMGAFIATLEHHQLVYELYKPEEHGLNHEDILRTDRQNWASAQRLCGAKVITCLEMLDARQDARMERSLGTTRYLGICGNYIDIFFNERLSLRERVVLCAKVSFFFRLWRLWILRGNPEVSGSTQTDGEVQKLKVKDSTISLETFYDIQISCHFVVLLIVLFRDQYPYLPVPLDLVGSDCCEQFFSKVGGMKGHERNYDFAELLDSATALNRLAQLELADGVMSLGKSHKKSKNIWMKLHPLLEGEQVANMQDFTGILTNEEVVVALKEGFVQAQNICLELQMCPSTPVKNQQWWTSPWELERFGEDNGEETDEETNEDAFQEDELSSFDSGDGHTSEHVVAGISDDDVSDSIVAQEDFRHSLSELMFDLTTHQTRDRVDPIVCFEGRRIYKSTLVSQLVGNPCLSKDRLLKVRQSLYFNNLVDKPKDREGARSIYLTAGADCGVVFLEEVAEPKTRAKVGRRSKGKEIAKRGRPISIMSEVPSEKTTWWIGRVQKIKKMYNGTWGRSREPVDLLNRPGPMTPIVSTNGRPGKVPDGTVHILCNWFTPTTTRLKYKYTTVDTQWIDLETVISLVTMNVRPEDPSLFVLDRSDCKCLDDFVKQSKLSAV